MLYRAKGKGGDVCFDLPLQDSCCVFGPVCWNVFGTSGRANLGKVWDFSRDHNFDYDPRCGASEPSRLDGHFIVTRKDL